MAKIIPPLVQEFPQPPADAVDSDDGDDWEPSPDQCEGILSLLYDAKEGRPGVRTILDLFTPEEREELLRDLPPRG